VRVRHNGVIERTVNLNRLPPTQALEQTQVRSGQFIISKIDARNGACGFVPPGLDGAVVSNDFPVFDIVGADPRYLDHLVALPVFWRLCETVSDGSTNRVRLDLEQFDQLRFPMPPLAEQRDIAAALDAIDEAIARSETAIAAAEVFQHAMLDDLVTRGVPGRHTEWLRVPGVGTAPACWHVAPLGDLLLAIEAGSAPPRLNRPAVNGEWGVLRVGAVTWGEYRPSENKALAPGVEAERGLEVRAGDLLLSRANTPELVGRTALVRSTPHGLLLSDKTLRLMPDARKTDQAFLHAVLGAAAARNQLSGAASGSSKSMFNISQANIRKVLLPVPPRDEQELIVKVGEVIRDALGGQATALTRLRAAKTALSDALLTGHTRLTASGQAAGPA